MIYSVLVEGFSSEIEEEILVRVSDLPLTCFASYLPRELEMGKFYQAEFLPMVFDEYLVEEVFHEAPSITKEGQSYSYKVVGLLKGDCLCCGELTLCDEVLMTDFGFLEGKLISWKIDRLDIFFV
jgi:hypothetical protein